MLFLLLACNPASISLGKDDSAVSETTDSASTTDTSDSQDSETGGTTDSGTDPGTTDPGDLVINGTLDGSFMLSGNNMQIGTCNGTFTLNVHGDTSFDGTADCESREVSATGPLSGSYAKNRLNGTWKATVWNQDYTFDLTGGGPADGLSISFSGSADGFQGQGRMQSQ